MNRLQTFIFILILALTIFSKDGLAQIEYKLLTVPSQPAKELKFSVHPIIQQYISYYQGRGRTSMEASIVRFGLHEKMIRRIFREEGIPEALSLINQVVYMWDMADRSYKSPKRLWQYSWMINKRYGLRQNQYLDETRSFEKATRATAQYLRFLSEKYKGSWELALAAYSSGERMVDLAIKRAKKRDFLAIYRYLSSETQNFAPNVLATTLIVGDLHKYGFENIHEKTSLQYDLVRVPSSISLDLIAQFSDANPQDIKELNPEFISTMTPPEPYIIRVPSGKGMIFVNRLMRYQKDQKLRHNP